MQLSVTVEQAHIGDTILEPVLSTEGALLTKKGHIIDARTIRLFKQMGIGIIKIEREVEKSPEETILLKLVELKNITLGDIIVETIFKNDNTVLINAGTIVDHDTFTIIKNNATNTMFKIQRTLAQDLSLQEHQKIERKVHVRDLRPGMVLLEPVLSKMGHIIARQDDLLDDPKIKSLVNSGVESVLVKLKVQIESTTTPTSTMSPLFDTEKVNTLLNMESLRFRFLRWARDDERLKGKLKLFENIVLELRNEENVLLGLEQISNAPLGDTLDHALEGMALASLMGMTLEYEFTTLVELAIATVLRDLGKLAVPFEVFSKKEPLTIKEKEQLFYHPLKSVKLLYAPTKLPKKVIEGIIQHHERWNGSGYPNRLKENQISEFGFIVGLVDLFCGMIAKRQYRQPFLPHVVMTFLEDRGNVLFPKRLIAIFKKAIAPYSNNVLIKLFSGEEAIVHNCDENDQLYVTVFIDKENLPVEQFETSYVSVKDVVDYRPTASSDYIRNPLL